MSAAIPGTCCICRQTMPANRIRRRLLHCIESRTGLKPSPDPRRRDRRRTARKTAHLSVRARERPTGWSWASGATPRSTSWTGSCGASGWNAAAM